MDEIAGWRSRGYLPHIDADGLTQFVTWRTADALPQHVLEAWKLELAELKDSERKRELARRTEIYCDAGHGACPMGEPRAGRAVQECLFHDHPSKYQLHAWAVMPNHVHVLFTPSFSVKLSTIMHRLKTASAHAVNKSIGRRGPLWQIESFDRFMRDSDHFERTARYIEWNPVKAKLCTDPKHWAWSSCNRDARARLEFLERSREDGSDA